MRIIIGKHWQSKLAELPETSMGAQHVDLILKSGKIVHDVPVFNGEECEVAQSFDPEEILDVRIHSK